MVPRARFVGLQSLGEGVREVSEKCLRDVCEMSVRCLRGVWLRRRCLNRNKLRIITPQGTSPEIEPSDATSRNLLGNSICSNLNKYRTVIL